MTETRRLWTVGVLLGLVVALLFVGSLAAGRSAVPLLEAIRQVVNNDTTTLSILVQEIRLPRACLALLVGASLGLSGAALQGLLRNPLAEPGVIGVSGCAALGAVLAFYSGLAHAFPLALPLFAMIAALLAVVLMYALAGRQSSTLTLILAGVAINSLSGALTALVLNLSPNPFAAYEIFFWLLGSFADRSFDQVLLAAPFMIVGWLLLFSVGRPLDALSLGEDSAAALGIHLGRTTFLVVLGTALCVGAGVSAAGVIGFVGLVVPHLLRPLVGHLPSLLLPLSALGGAALTLAADMAARFLGRGPELKVGVVTALLGAPFFLHLVLRGRHTLR